MKDGRRTADARREAALVKAKAADAFTVEELTRIAALPLTTARTYVKRWLEDGEIVLVRKDERFRYYLSAEKRYDPSILGSTEKTPEGNMWRAIRQYRQFSPLDIATVSNAGGVEVSVEKARAYCRVLLEAGYLRVVDRAVPGRREAMYRLVQDTGPAAPVVRRISVLLDPNTDQMHAQGRRTKA